MADMYFDFGTNVQSMLGVIQEQNEVNEDRPIESAPEHADSAQQKRRKAARKMFLEVRKSVCIVGLHREYVQDVKLQVGELFDQAYPLESFHVTKPSDIHDGALLVPKLILVAAHCPGRKLIDDVGDEGQLDFLYDEACDIGADVLLMYVGLPKAVYANIRHALYHPRLSEVLFPDQPILKELASENCFITVTENSKMNDLQKNLIREWLDKPVTQDHPVFQALESMASPELTLDDLNFDETPTLDRQVPGNENTFVPATEEHPLADGMGRKSRKFRFGRKKKDKSAKDHKPKQYRTKVRHDLGTLQEDVEEYDNSNVELDSYSKSQYANAMETTSSGPM